MPSAFREWKNVSQERANDADAMLSNRSKSSGPPYMAGYAVECILKAWLERLDKGVPKSGSKGHDLKALWKKLGLRLKDLADQRGHKAFFLQQWSTDMRYETTLPENHSAQDLVQAAQQISRQVRTLMRRRRK